MRIDGQALTRDQVLKVNAVLDNFWDSAYFRQVDKETFVTSTWGPDAIEILIGGEVTVVCNMNNTDEILYREDPDMTPGNDRLIKHIGSAQLFHVCAEFSPLERL